MTDQLDFFSMLENPTVEQLLTPDQVYEADDVELILRLGEDHRLDYKSARRQPKEFAKDLSAFGNGPSHMGGVIVVGVENDGSISGCKSLDETSLQKLEAFGSTHCEGGSFEYRRLKCKNFRDEEDFIILCRVYYVPNRLVILSDGSAYQRISDTTRKLNDEDKNEIRIAKGERSFELEVSRVLYPDDFHLDRIRKFCLEIRRQDNISDEISDEQILENKLLGYRTSSGFSASNALVLMFAKQPQREFPGAYIRVLRFEGTEQKSGKYFNVIKDRTFEGTIIEQIQGVANFLSANLREFTSFENGRFESRPEYPNDAWYELLVNAVAHRSYQYKHANIFVRMFDDRIEFESPGGFMPQVTPTTIFSLHRPRNRQLMFAMKELGEVKCMNEGTKRVRQEMEDAKLPAPIFRPVTQENTGVLAILSNDIANRQNSLDSEAYLALGEALSLSLSPEERKIVNFAIENGRVNVSEALRIMKTNIWHTAKSALKRLERRGILEFRSSKTRDPNAHYVMATKKDDGSIRQG
jgi:ATP-dependent DNA helicase RecG